MSSEQKPTWLTQEAYDRLAAELEQLVNFARADIAKRIQEAREEGDLKENGGYHAAKDEQGKIEARTNRIEEILATSVVGQAPESHGVVEQGVLVTIELNGDETEFLLGSAEIGEGTDVTVYSPDSQLGQVIIGKSIGDEATFYNARGREMHVKIVGVRSFNG